MRYVINRMTARYQVPHPTRVNFTSLTDVFRHVKTKIIFLSSSKQDLNEIVSDGAINFL